jgi:hypothetical protein
MGSVSIDGLVQLGVDFGGALGGVAFGLLSDLPHRLPLWGTTKARVSPSTLSNASL